MPITFACPNCHTPYTVNDRAAGKEVACAACGQQVLVPATTPPPATGPVVVYVPPPVAEDVPDYAPAPYRERPPREERVYVREDVRVVHHHQGGGAFGTAFNSTLGVLTALGIVAMVILTFLLCLCMMPNILQVLAQQ